MRRRAFGAAAFGLAAAAVSGRAYAAPTPAVTPTPGSTPVPTPTPSASVTRLPSQLAKDLLPFPPVPGAFVGARWGAVGAWSRYHTGLDFPAPIGTPVLAVADGVVVTPDMGGWAGTHVVIDHGPLGRTVSTHLSAVLVKVGDKVTQGQVIGRIGMTGRTFGPHLCFHYFPAGVASNNPYLAKDPWPFLLSLTDQRKPVPAPGRKPLAKTGF